MIVDTQIPDASVDRVLALLDEVDRLRDERRYEKGFWTAQEALQAMPTDGSMERSEFEELQLAAVLKREYCQLRWSDQLGYNERREQPAPGPASPGPGVPA